VSPQVVETGVFMLVVLTARIVAARGASKAKRMSEDLRRRWMIQVRNLTFLVIVLGLTIIWAEELQTFALSAVAVAAALVIATKELIMCVSGTLLEGSAKSFRVGDRVEVGPHRGDVYDQTLLTTTLLEVGPGQAAAQYTGRAVVLPNSIFLSQPVVNETFTEAYILHTVVVPVSMDDNWQQAERALLQAADEACAEYIAEARQHMEKVTKARGLHPLSVEPRVTLRLPEPGRLDLLLRMPVPAKRRGRVEQTVLRRALPTIHEATSQKAE
jgi:small-conductance mechanosensitive channel